MDPPGAQPGQTGSQAKKPGWPNQATGDPLTNPTKLRAWSPRKRRGGDSQQRKKGCSALQSSWEADFSQQRHVAVSV